MNIVQKQQELQLFLKEHIQPDSKVVVGVSGGPDSVFLLNECLSAQKAFSFEIIAAHVNYHLRGKESNLDEAFVKKLCQKNKLSFKLLKINLKKQKGNIEANARDIRYNFFEKTRQKYQADWILVAHQSNDNIETVLFNLIRGSGLTGLKGMNRVSKSRFLLRPLLHFKKKEILQLLKKNKITYRIDKTNLKTDFSRNLIRLKAIPIFEKINKNFLETFSQNLKNFAALAEDQQMKTKEWIKKNNYHNTYSLDKFLIEATYQQKNILSLLYEKTYGSTKKLTHQQLNEMLKVLNQRKSNVKKEFGSDFFITVIKERSDGPRLIAIKQKALKKAKK